MKLNVIRVLPWFVTGPKSHSCCTAADVIAKSRKGVRYLIPPHSEVHLVACLLISLLTAACANPRRDADAGRVRFQEVPPRQDQPASNPSPGKTDTTLARAQQPDTLASNNEFAPDAGNTRFDDSDAAEVNKAVRAYLRTLPVYDAERSDEQGVFLTKTHPPDCGGVVFCVKTPPQIRHSEKVSALHTCLQNVAYRNTKQTPHYGADFGATEESTWIAVLDIFVTQTERYRCPHCCCYILDRICK